MKSPVIILSSLTEANKAKSLLTSYKIKCAVKKVTARKGGCAFGVKVFCAPEKAVKVLNSAGIKCAEVVYE